MTWPKPVGGSTSRVGWLNRLLGKIVMTHIKQVVGGKLIPSTDGTVLVIDRQSASVSMVEISICVDGDPEYFAKVAMGTPYKKDGDGNPYVP